jgi:hypothetical protein
MMMKMMMKVVVVCYANSWRVAEASMKEEWVGERKREKRERESERKEYLSVKSECARVVCTMRLCVLSVCLCVCVETESFLSQRPISTTPRPHP